LLDAHRRGLLAHDNMDHRGSHALIAARALLTVAASGTGEELEEHIGAFADNGGLLTSFLRALAAAAEETQLTADSARRVWPGVIRQVIALHAAGARAFEDHHYGESALASLMPTPAPDWTYLHREIESTPCQWSDVIAWRETIEAWVQHAAGRPECLDSLIGMLRNLQASDQAEVGLPWVSAVAYGDIPASARRSWFLSDWLVEIRPAAADAGILSAWQSLVDALVVAGANELAPYSE
jgi:hypothetical protein